MTTANTTTTAPGTFRPFDNNDWNAWAGCESSEPLIAVLHDQRSNVIIDGATVHFSHCDDEFGPSEFYHEYDCAATAEAVAHEVVRQLLDKLPDQEHVFDVIERFAFVQVL